MTFSQPLVAVAIMLVGAIVYLVPTPPMPAKVCEVGRIAYWSGLLGVVWMLVT